MKTLQATPESLGSWRRAAGCCAVAAKLCDTTQRLNHGERWGLRKREAGPQHLKFCGIAPACGTGLWVMPCTGQQAEKPHGDQQIQHDHDLGGACLLELAF